MVTTSEENNIISSNKNIHNLSLDIKEDRQNKSTETNGLKGASMMEANEKESNLNAGDVDLSSRFNEDVGTSNGSQFKAPKKAAKTDLNRITGNTEPSQVKVQSNDSLPTHKIDPSKFDNLNKSLKAKQKITSSKDGIKNPINLATPMNASSPHASVFSHNVLPPAIDSELENTHNKIISSTISNNIPNDSVKNTSKRSSKQNSTRKEFFAAKLASAVDDVNTSDSDETFVYENSAPEFDSNQYSHKNGPNSNAENFVGSGATSSIVNATMVEEEPKTMASEETIKSTNGSKAAPTKSLNAILNINPQSQSNAINIKNEESSSPPMTTEGKNRPTNRSSTSSYSVPQLPLGEFEEVQKQNRLPANKERKRSTSSLSVNYKYTNRLGNLNAAVSERLQSMPSNGRYQNESSSSTHNYRQSSNIGSINGDSNEEQVNYSYDDMETDLADDSSIDDDVGSSIRNISSSHTTMANARTGFGNEYMEESSHGTGVPQNTSFNARNPNSKNSRTANFSKLRSTTSKIFDKAGSQPRRYSIIPDDVDIEDFDDDLIYYDNNIHFPYNNVSHPNNTTETSSLLNNSRRIPHYKSLNFSSPKREHKSKRYLSTGQPINSRTRYNFLGVKNNNSKTEKTDIFPFTYPENLNYSYDFDKFEDGKMNMVDEESDFYQTPKRGSVGIAHHQLTPHTGHFLLPRKKSHTMADGKMTCIKNFMYTSLSIIIMLSIGFVMGFILATTKDLSDVSISNIENPLVSKDELIFNLMIDAVNPGWFTISIEEVELDIFAKSGYIPDEEDSKQEIDLQNSVETVLLGTINQFESPVSFSGGFLRRDMTEQSAEVKLLSPGKNLTNFEKEGSNDTSPDNSRKWELISKNPFDLIIRGIFKYNLPMSKSFKSVVVNKIAYIDPKQEELLFRDLYE